MNPAARALEAVLALLEDAGITATRDAGSFVPAPVGVLVGLPSWMGSTLAGRVFEIPVLVVSGDPLSEPANVDRIYAIADEIADVAGASSYRPATWTSSARPEPLPALEIIVTATATLEEV